MRIFSTKLDNLMISRKEPRHVTTFKSFPRRPLVRRRLLQLQRLLPEQRLQRQNDQLLALHINPRLNLPRDAHYLLKLQQRLFKNQNLAKERG